MSENWPPKYQNLRKIYGKIITENSQVYCKKLNFSALLNTTRCFRCAIEVLIILGFKIFWNVDIEGMFWHFRTRFLTLLILGHFSDIFVLVFWHYGTGSFFWHFGTWPFSLTILDILWKSWSMSSCTESKF